MAEHPIVHVEFSARNPKADAEFYSKLFGWQTRVDPGSNYWMFAAEGGPGGGFNTVGENPDGFSVKPGDVIVYVMTENIEASLANVEELGGKTVQAKTEIPGMGWYALFNDPTGNCVGLFTPAMNQ